jgi:hypothetical protein
MKKDTKVEHIDEHRTAARMQDRLLTVVVCGSVCRCAPDSVATSASVMSPTDRCMAGEVEWSWLRGCKEASTGDAACLHGWSGSEKLRTGAVQARCAEDCLGGPSALIEGGMGQLPAALG